MARNNHGKVMLPGMEKFVKKEESEWFWDGQKNEKYFDAAALPDTPDRQANAKGAQTYILYVIFPDYEGLTRAVQAFTEKRRKTLAAGSRIASLDGTFKPDGDLEFIEIWEEKMLGIKPKKKKVNTDEAQAPI